MPFHCQKRMLIDLSFSLADLYGFTQKQESPVALVDSPIPSFETGNTPSENVLAYARTSSSKKDKDKKPKAVPDIHLPEETVEVKIPAIDMSEIPDFQDASVGLQDACDISDIVVPSIANIQENVKTAEARLAKVQAAYATSVAGVSASSNPAAAIFTAVVGGWDTGKELTNHALWFYNIVKPGGDWDYKNMTKEMNGKKTIWEPFGNFHYGVVGAAAGFNRGKTLQRMAGLVHEQSGQPGDGGHHGGYGSIVADWIRGSDGGTNLMDPRRTPKAPYKDELADQVLINRGIAYYNAGCHKR